MAGAVQNDQQAGLGVFKEILHQLGWIDGRNVRVEVRWAGGDPVKARKDAEELVALPANVILANGQLGWKRCCERLAPCRSCLTVPSIRLVVASSTAWRDPVATQLALFCLNMPWP